MIVLVVRSANHAGSGWVVAVASIERTAYLLPGLRHEPGAGAGCPPHRRVSAHELGTTARRHVTIEKLLTNAVIFTPLWT